MKLARQIRQLDSRGRRSRLGSGLGLALSSLLLAGAILLNLKVGAVEISWNTLRQALTAFDGSTTHLLIRTVRLPRTFLAVIVGAALAIAGAITQGITRNPLAAPDILGIEAGASLVMVLSLLLFDSSSLSLYGSFAGAAIAALTVYGLGSVGRSGMTPLKLVIAGAALTSLITSITTSLLIASQQTLDEIRFWLAGSLVGRDWDIVSPVLPYLIIGLVVAIAIGRSLTLLTLGEAVAQGLGLRTLWIKGCATTVVILLAGSSVALAGPIGFVGLVVPHLARFWAGSDYRWILPYAAIFGGILLSLADMVARLLIPHQELPVGIVTALIGAPFFIYVARSQIKL